MTSLGDGSSIGTGEVEREGAAERQEDLRQVQDHSQARSRHGHLLQPEAQAETGIGVLEWLESPV
jgi:hypothetical protein